jgi:hypothetical protein
MIGQDTGSLGKTWQSKPKSLGWLLIFIETQYHKQAV